MKKELKEFLFSLLFPLAALIIFTAICLVIIGLVYLSRRLGIV